MPVALIIVFGFLLRASVAVWNGLWGPSIGAEGDALEFHERAAQLASNLNFYDFRVGSVPYVNGLGFYYYMTSDSLLLGGLLSCVAWLASAFLLVKSMELLSFSQKAKSRAMLYFALLPSSIVFTGVTLREPFQLLFVCAAAYSALKIYHHRSIIHWLWMVASLIGMGVLHGGLFIAGLVIIGATFFLLAFREKSGVPIARFILVVPLVGLIAFYGLSLFASVSYNIDQGVDSAIESYQEGGLRQNARTNYKDGVEINGLAGLTTFIPVSLFQYLFEPMPWRVSTAFDAEVLVENGLRLWLLLLLWHGWSKIGFERRKSVFFLLVSFLAIETIWSIGTINWGTAIRHHIPSMGLLIIATYTAQRDKTAEALVLSPAEARAGSPVT